MKYLPLLLLLCFQTLSAQKYDPEFVPDIARHRAEYKADFLTDARSPLTAADTAFLDFFLPNPAYRFIANFERTPQAAPFELPTYSGQKRDYVQFGVLKFEVAGQPQTLNIYQNLRLVKDSTYRDHLFVPFKDSTNGETTYGGGRYLDFRQGDIREGILVLDFNKCYNPWCAFSDGFNCPIPPASNHLEIAIEAGEKNYRGKPKH
ncbi:MAG: DUF1684 domain-containing protein [Phycisphaerae bacterium]|nr:DUF1684 domain-containing protein [Saprospiraceae bacterium]